MKEWIIGRNPVMEVIQAKRRQVFRLLFASGVEEKGRIAEMMRASRFTENPSGTRTAGKIGHAGRKSTGCRG